MDWLWNLNFKKAFIIYIIVDLICLGPLGMTVPFFSILLGFPVGWYVSKRLYSPDLSVKTLLNKIFKYSLITSGFTFLMMIIAWGRIIPMIWGPTADMAHFGLPMILYDPVASFIGWIILMIFISPFLQFLTTVFAANLTVIRSES
ncbi:hypothetical protein Metbo_1392 [Methanobacterium lacus]|uniref:Uncharacterized protein n=1 Tax=Methanobacterium lacus (strain AL-21) TaxID=877455 RepID=F0T806_METLA|nr:hypothetical protein [Methanobacterium lacus]ADZ09632.1 hypothetical protein Metbo_1392 [Methanobacterium lacus]